MTPPTIHSGLITRAQLRQELSIKDIRKIQKMIVDGDLPAYSFGGPKGAVCGWHRDVLRRFYMERYELQQGLL